MTAAHTTETQMVGLVRNALLVAGQEMGDKGDHWPVINATIGSIMKDWEQLQIERNVHAELQVHLAKWLDELQAAIVDCPADIKPEMEKCLQELRDIYNAYFEVVAINSAMLAEENVPQYVKRAEAIINTLGGNND